LKDSVAAGLERVKYCEDQFVDMKMQFDLLMMTVREGQDKSVGKEQVLPSTVRLSWNVCQGRSPCW